MTSLKSLVTEIVETDVLIVGGGISGCFAAIGACKQGAAVVIAEKANIKRSGDAHLGTDHISLFSEDPRISPVSPTKEAELIKTKPFVDTRLPYDEIFAETYDRVLDLENMGCKVRRPDGEFIRTPGGWPGGIITMAVDQKANLAKEVNRIGIKVYNRTMVTQLLTYQGAIAGAIGINIRNGDFILFRAKAVILTTGKAIRIYPTEDRALLGGFGAMGLSPTSSGDGFSLALKAGVKIINMEFIRGAYTIRNPKWWSSSGSMGHSRPAGQQELIVDTNNKPVSGHIKPTKTRELSQDYHFVVTSGANPVAEALKAGRGPLYYDATSWPDYNQKLFRLGNACESPIILKYLMQSGVDWQTHQIEINDEPRCRSLELGMSGVKIDGKCETCVSGLFAAGDTAGGTFYAWLPGSMTLGHRAGRFAAEYAHKTRLLPIDEKDVARGKEKAFAPLKNNGMIPWEEMERTIQYLMKSYIGFNPCKVEAFMQRGLEMLTELREKLMPQLKAQNYHELMRCLEQYNIFDVAEMHALSASTRKESRFGTRHSRIDYPDTDDAHWGNKIIVLQMQNGKMNVSIAAPDKI